MNSIAVAIVVSSFLAFVGFLIWCYLHYQIDRRKARDVRELTEALRNVKDMMHTVENVRDRWERQERERARAHTSRPVNPKEGL